MPTPRPKRRTPPPWIKPAVHFSICFLLGVLTGFSHPTTHQQQILIEQDLAIPTIPITHTAPPNPNPPPLPLPTFTPSSPRLLIVVTTTRSGDRLQLALLHRLSQTLRLVPAPLLWIVVEVHEGMEGTADLLRRTGILYRHLTYKEKFAEVGEEKHHQRNVALSHVEHHRLEGIVCFAEADNVYDLLFFDAVRDVDVFGVWPIAVVSAGEERGITVEGPVCNASQVVGWYRKNIDGTRTSETTARPEVNIWGFGFNSSVLWDPERWGRPTSFPDNSQAHGFGFGTLAFTTLGELSSDLVDFLKRLRNFSSSHDCNVKVGNFLFQRLGIVIQKGVGAQLVARLPTNFLPET